MAEGVNRYIVLVAVFILALAIVIFRANLAGVVWNPLGSIGGTKPANDFSDLQKLIAGIVIVGGGIAAAFWANKITKDKSDK